MGVIETNTWLDEDFDDPLEICTKVLEWKNRSEKYSKLVKTRRTEAIREPRGFYRYLQNFGMYRPTRLSKESFEELKQKRVWSMVEQLYEHYRHKWIGQDIPIFIFPFGEKQGLFGRSSYKNKSGLSFHDKLFLFLTPKLTKQDIEALFVHEYHHVCRMNTIDKRIEDYNLLDSIILEGVAEVAVEAECGSNYLAPWCTRYTEKQLTELWKKYVADHLSVKKMESLHDQILFGERGFPTMLGYAAGYLLAKKYYHDRPFSIGDTFTVKSHKFLETVGDW
ncbi:DUF2268 domain-containing protein [Bacillus sp. DNRA2]|uniref:DUF2268 domain-containing protein n=1 Tax=Bacillus sp. DNRA2 TaxID=2723053 RepID=UPI00145D1325|nr:DUF2268 domain-containing putative Zn-dependent protease [Bacillus sp. DNRA2]NMD70797.1 DUF2268 domain-containing protein [Bacillus sp. DNRA2]